MKKDLIFSVIIIFCFFNFVYSQTLTEPKLVGTWIKGEDFGEFIFHKTEELNYHLGENPDGRIVARLCSKKSLPEALVNSNGFAYQFPRYTNILKIPAGKVFFARSSKCGGRLEQYWFVPEKSNLDYDEIIPSEKVTVRRLVENYDENPESQSAKKEFADNIENFIEELKNNPQAKGFVIRNIKTKNRYIQKALRKIQTEKVDKLRFQLVTRKIYSTHFPEFIIITINK